MNDRPTDSQTTEAPDIVRMLRDFCGMGLEGGDSDPLIEVMHSVASQAATEIERLRGALLEIVRTLCAVAREGSGSSQMTATWRHKKRGTLYTEIGRGTFQVAGDTSIADEERVVIYRGDDGRLWVRPIAEFEDGRFEKVSGA